METLNDFIITVADERHLHYAEAITAEMAESAKARGTGIAQRSPEYVRKKMQEGKAVVAFHKDGTWAGFCYIETWGHGKFVANSGLIVYPDFRKHGLAKAIKYRIFELSRKKYPDAKIFGLTTGFAVMKINSELGYEPVPYSELTDDEEFWKGCQSCVNHDILMSKERKNCFCTAMLYDPVEKEKERKQKEDTGEKLEKITHKASLLERINARLKRSAKMVIFLVSCQVYSAAPSLVIFAPGCFKKCSHSPRYAHIFCIAKNENNGNLSDIIYLTRHLSKI